MLEEESDLRESLFRALPSIFSDSLVQSARSINQGIETLQGLANMIGESDPSPTTTDESESRGILASSRISAKSYDHSHGSLPILGDGLLIGSERVLRRITLNTGHFAQYGIIDRYQYSNSNDSRRFSWEIMIEHPELKDLGNYQYGWSDNDATALYHQKDMSTL